MDVFVYGTLTDPDRVGTVVESFVFVGPAVLEGCRPVVGRYPTLVPGGETAGRLLRTPDIDALDAHEGVETGPYVRVSVSRTDGGTVAVYVGDPDELVDGDGPGGGLAADERPTEWPGDGPFADRVRRYLDAEAVVVRPQRS
ncbi:gamma-glutamylcyclotransferase family protein [Haloplanus sp.]|uniref:gamma-glutamylcyclotransferase family protein n=1 Tax=Haloplanus sp. TaxID=1961696 RepID=UPI00260C7D08|nr:gamma-glutamylcyclotransferase family protein [Haloplanus sp.]